MSILPLSKLVDVDDFASSDLVPYLQEVHGLANVRFRTEGEEIRPDALLWQHAMALRALDAAGAARAGRMVACIDFATAAREGDSDASAPASEVCADATVVSDAKMIDTNSSRTMSTASFGDCLIA